ncbi:response regulator transcription factor [Dethiobacter alkaliphilus]|uniref:Two component transcriptional regulator, winged helix family n=1 Tax=Dethiobacter alkaliphilus AHT 1 TaxID=555088 RepID=C0GFM0_DETAL|nr:response regulator transcription factor [Dethiobacter alkaliphilus]EEG77980.1 two component transcriptional regulator, winged helix family [Dethiobacter alkaliphilus AHT 1]
MTEKILVVDDEEKIRRILRQVLENEGFTVLEAENGSEALSVFLNKNPVLVILDVMMPEMDGIEFLKKIRPQFDTPVIILSAKDALVDKAVGFTLDIDDYVSKPFSALEMAMRVKAVLKRYRKVEKSSAAQDIVKIGELEINFDSYQLFAGGEEIDLTPREFKLLGILMRNAGMVLSREQLLELADDREYFGDLNVINVFVRRLRQKIEKDPANPKYLQTVWGVGYKFSKI